ncbi:hypothetical protein MVEN_00859500 [Mycena venus]|uniref:Uncharacterized protein n=1 Tax=Mycena venus TaxID=2733690 RepID=A0A8H6YH18_9AGAR|nr:hypothetical protein MVEN_00859500 [Mycena venus]
MLSSLLEAVATGPGLDPLADLESDLEDLKEDGIIFGLPQWKELHAMKRAAMGESEDEDEDEGLSY